MSVSYGGLLSAQDLNVPHLGGSIKAGDPNTFCPSVWDYAISRFSISSVLDLGSGCGNASQYFFKRGLTVVAVEGLKNSVLSSVYPAVLIDLTKTCVTTRVDLVHCQEVVEHIEEEYLPNLMESLTCGRIIMITHALPGQPGYHHVNCQHSEYWIESFRRFDCDLLEGDTQRIRALARTDGAPYMEQTGLLFVNNRRFL